MPFFNKNLTMVDADGKIVDTLAEDRWKQYRSKGSLMAVKMEYDFKCKNGEEWEHGHAGDYMCMGISGALHCVTAEIFEMIYEETCKSFPDDSLL